MRRYTLLLALAALAGALPGAAVARTEVDGPPGALCSFVMVDGRAVITGGPVVGDGTLTCTIQVGGYNHAEVDNGASASASNSGVVVMNPTLRSVAVPKDVPLYLCTEWMPSVGPTVYWYSSNDPTVDGHWDTDATSPCSLATTAGTDDTDPVTDLVDSIVCPVLPLVFTGTLAGTVTITPEGDVLVAGSPVHDCPPYGNGNALPDTTIAWATGEYALTALPGWQRASVRGAD